MTIFKRVKRQKMGGGGPTLDYLVFEDVIFSLRPQTKKDQPCKDPVTGTASVKNLQWEPVRQFKETGRRQGWLNLRVSEWTCTSMLGLL